MPPQVIGFAASLVLLASLVGQIWKQWSSGRSEGVSPWLFAGQALANVGMLAYSVMLRDTVFIVTNTATLATSLLGLAVQRHHARRKAAQEAERTSPAAVSGCAS